MVTAWAIEKLDRIDESTEWLDNQEVQYLDNNILEWGNQVFENEQYVKVDIYDSEVRILQQLLNLQ